MANDFHPVPGDENRGGYDCDFVNPPPEAFQTACPVCLQILKEPCLIGCHCGHKFCRECIEAVQRDNKPCPRCKFHNFTFMRDHGFERSLKELEVWCSHKKEGCEWRGKLGELEKHLNQDPSPENKQNGCKFKAVECVHKCGEWFQRRHIATHQKEQCKKRPYSCDYCRDYASTFEDVVGVHYPQCDRYPVACPNDCQSGDHDHSEYKMEQQDLEGHLRDKCPLTLVDCPFHYAGCETQLPRKDMPEHMKDTVTHLTLLATVTQRLVKENQELKERVLEREDESHKSMEAVQAFLQKLNQELKQSTANAENEIRAHKEEEQQLRLDLQQLINTSERLLEVRVKYTEGEVYSPAFYTHPYGYRMCVRVNPKGRGDGEGTHVSIFMYMMCGPFDDYLKWPFRGEITIQLVNQAGDHGHVEYTIPYNDATPGGAAGRVTGSERATNAWGFPQVLAHSRLDYNAARKTLYLKDNHVIVRVVKVVLK